MPNLIDLISKEDAEKARKMMQAREERSDDTVVPPKVFMLAEFGMMYGWQAVEAVLNDEIDFELMFYMTKAGRKLRKNAIIEVGDIMRLANEAGTPLRDASEKDKIWRQAVIKKLKET